MAGGKSPTGQARIPYKEGTLGYEILKGRAIKEGGYQEYNAQGRPIQRTGYNTVRRPNGEVGFEIMYENTPTGAKSFVGGEQRQAAPATLAELKAEAAAGSPAAVEGQKKRRGGRGPARGRTILERETLGG